MKERTKLLLIILVFAACYYIPWGNPTIRQSGLESFMMLQEYAREHVLTCLIPAFFIAGAIAVFVKSIMSLTDGELVKLMEYRVGPNQSWRDPNRVKIVKMLQYGELCVCEIQEALGTSQPTVSKHLKLLEGTDILKSRKEGRWAHYRLDDGSSSPYAASMLGNLKHWLEETPEIAEIVKRLPAIRSADICGA